MAKKYTFFILMDATPEWLSLSREERSAFVETELMPIYKKYSKVSVRMFDAEAFSAECSDIAMYETEDVEQYHFMIDAIRDTKIFSVPYFEIVSILPAVEEGYTRYDEHLKDA